MPNGISCAFFAVKNYAYGKQNKDIFRDGIAGAQAARTVDTIAKGTNAAAPVTNALGKVANVAKKIVYPLIVLSGVYTTAKSDDKVRTGVQQAGGISTMYAFEQIAEKGLKSAEKYLQKSSVIPNNKFSKIALYLLRGISYVTASLVGYDAGKKIGGSIVDFIREKKENSALKNIDEYRDSGNIYDDFTEFMYEDEDSTVK